MRLGSRGDSNVDDLSRPVFDDEEREDRSEPEFVGLEKVARPNLVALVGEKPRPGLATARTRRSTIDHPARCSANAFDGARVRTRLARPHLRVRRDTDEVQNAHALRRPNRAGADVLPFEARLAGTQGSHDGIGDVVASVFAAGISAWQDEEGRGVLDDDASDVGRFRDEPSFAFFLDLKGQGLQPRHLGGKSRCLVLALTALGEPLCALAESPVVVQLDSSPFRCGVVRQSSPGGQGPGTIPAMSGSSPSVGLVAFARSCLRCSRLFSLSCCRSYRFFSFWRFAGVVGIVDGPSAKRVRGRCR